MILTIQQARAAAIAITAMAVVGGTAAVTVGNTDNDAVRVFNDNNEGTIRVVRVVLYRVAAAEQYGNLDEFCAAYGV